jgi:hypothetical protein
MRSHFDLDDWIGCLIGEIGEAANIVKKLRRIECGWPNKLSKPIETYRAELAEEYADIFTYFDIVCIVRRLPPSVIHAETLTLWHERTLGQVVSAAAAEIQYDPELRAFRRLLHPLDRMADPSRASRVPSRTFLGIVIALADRRGIDFETAIRNKFNIVSDRMGSGQRL